ncbi:ATP-binding protein [Streptomyces sp. PmtA]|uniref:ATP-binding protein n=1 Tax=Streptomyces sp. PmtA TaxID=3074275 RepID=UPI0030153471
MAPQSDHRGRPEDAFLIEAGYALSGDHGCIAQARHHAVDFLGTVRSEHGLDVSSRAVDLTQLIVSELVTNARKYAPGPVLMELRITRAAVEVMVWDSDPTVPTPRAADPHRVGQHGLEIVEAVAQSLDITRHAVGKRITARLALSDRH